MESRWELEQVLRELKDQINSTEVDEETISRIQKHSKQLRIYQSIISGTPDLIFVFDLEYKLIYANEAMLAMQGLYREKAIGKRLSELGYEQENAIMKREVDHVVATKQPAKGEISLTGIQGSNIYDYILVPVFGIDNEVEAVAKIFRNITDRKIAKAAVEQDLRDVMRLQNISSKLIREGEIEALFEEILDAAVEMMEADKGSMHMLDWESGTLQIKAQREFSKSYIDYFSAAKTSTYTEIGKSLEQRKRLIIPDIKKSQIYSAPSRKKMLEEGLRSAQTTPLISRFGKLLGMISTYWNHVHEPREHQLRLLDLLARQAADLIEQRLSEIALRKSEQHLRSINFSLEKQSTKLKKQAKNLRYLLTELNSAELRERKRLAAVLHDDLQQLLAAAKMYIQPARKSKINDEVSIATEKSVNLLDQAIEVTRNLTHQLRPPVLYEKGLGAALKWLASEMQERHHLRISILTENLTRSISSDLIIIIFDSVRELLFNVVKHAGVNEAWVTAKLNNDHLLITVKDYGQGFDVNKITGRKQGKFGLFSIRERFEALDGTMDIQSEPGKGVQVDLVIPVAENSIVGKQTEIYSQE